ncbi:CoA pyrophosphatase [Flavobacteriaceae bacterium S356]|uniref:CoA pyrophosphatase n=1 Tax=Asprobacillus argus TaxID=3076534 RepID=A0ABU3LEJ1_9FLAO|nr:CoA pyrophosphatase [Flavobacteriaceae bacterium S356]
MYFDEFLSKLNQVQFRELGGLDAQFKLAPKLRLRYNQQKIEASNPKKAAVLSLFYPNKENKATFLLTLRASYNGKHSSQISFPGGKIEQRDKDLKEAALREAFEEVGILKNEVHIVRETTDVYIPPSNFLATPFIAYTNKRPVFTKNYEVESLIEVLVEDLLNEANITSTTMTTSYMEKIEVPCFKLNNYIVWGATAMMLSEIKELLK